MNRDYNIIIIGAGPAGAACALQLRRYGLDPLVLEKEQVGGMLRNASLIENYLGFPEGISSEILIRSICKHIEKYKVSLLYNKVLSVDMLGKDFLVSTREEKYTCRSLVIASGTSPGEYPDVTLPEALNSRIAYDANSFRELEKKRFSIIGAGDAAFDYALQLTSKNNRIDIFNRTANIKCIKLLMTRAMDEPNISYHPFHKLREISKGTDKEEIRLVFDVAGKTSFYSGDYLIFATGRKPELSFLSDNLKHMQEELMGEKRLFMVGDVNNDLYRQVSIAGGDGIRAAMAIHHEYEK